MGQIKRSMAIIIAIIMLTNFSSGLLECGSIKVQAAKPDVIKEATTGRYWKDWNDFATAAYNTPDISGWKVTLTEDITLSGEIKMLDKAFEGVFDGDGHVITIEDGSYFTSKFAQRRGLFDSIEGPTAVLKNLVVYLEGTLYADQDYSLENAINDGEKRRGVMVGVLNRGTIENCAVLGGGTFKSYVKSFATTSSFSFTGGITGEIYLGTVSNSYAAINVESVFIKQSHIYHFVGGITGDTRSGTIQNCFYSGKVSGYNQNSNDLWDNNVSVSALTGGVRGSADATVNIRNNVVKDVSLNGYKLKSYTNGTLLGEKSGNGGRIYAKINESPTLRLDNNYASPISMEGTNLWMEDEAKPINNAKASALGDKWADTVNGMVALDWMVADAKKSGVTITVTTNTLPGEEYAQFTFAPKNPSDPGIPMGPEFMAPWKYKMSALTQGKMATPTGARLKMIMGPVIDTGPPPITWELHIDGADRQTRYQISSSSVPPVANVSGWSTYSAAIPYTPPLTPAANYLHTYKQSPSADAATDSDILTFVIPETLVDSVLSLDAGSKPIAPETVSQPKEVEGVIEGNVTPVKIKFADVFHARIDTSVITISLMPSRSRYGKCTEHGEENPNFISLEPLVKTVIASDVTMPPTIFPKKNDIIDQSKGIWFEKGSGSGEACTIYYTLTPDNGDMSDSFPVVPTVAGEEPTDPRTYKYTGQQILYPDDSKFFTVRAAAIEPGKKKSMTASTQYSASENLEKPVMPILQLGTSVNHPNFSAAQTYPADSEIYFSHPKLDEGIIYFTTNGQNPSKIDTSGVTKQYNPNAQGLQLPSNAGISVTIKAYYTVTRGIDSDIATFKVNLKQSYDAPVPSIVDNSQVREDQALYFSLSKDTLLATGIAGITYIDGVPAAIADAELGDNVKITGVPNPEHTYITYEIPEDAVVALPKIAYAVGADEETFKDYVFALREVYYSYDGSGKKIYKTVSYRNPGIINLSGDPKEKIVIKAKTLTQDSRFSDSMVSSFRYTIREGIAALIANPADNARVKPGDIIRLSVTTPDTQFFYTMDGSKPQIRYDKNSGWVVTSSNDGMTEDNVPRGTYLYTYQGVTVPNLVSVTLPIHAIAVHNTNSQQESEATFLYEVRRGAVGEITASPQTGTQIKPGQPILLTVPTANTQLYYTLDGTSPEIHWDISSSLWKIDSASTKLYTGPIEIPENKTILTVYTLAVSTNNSLETSRNTFVYYPPDQIAPVLATPNGGGVLKNTKVKLSCTTSGVSIYYDIYKSKSQAEAAAPPSAEKSQIYDDNNPIIITDDTCIYAITVKEGVKSTARIFDYTISTQLKPPTSSLATGSVVYKGSKITLEAQDGGTVAYTTDGSDPKADLASSSSNNSSSSSSSQTDKKTNPAVMYGDKVVLDAAFGSTVTVRSYAFGDGYTPSDVSAFTYTICEKEDYLKASPVAGQTVKPGDTISLSTAITNGVLYYTTDGSSPTVKTTANGKLENTKNGKKGNSVKVAGITGGAFTVKAIAVADGVDGQVEQVFTYKIAEETSAPTASIPSGAITLDGAKVELTVNEGTIYYTTDGAEPTTSSYLYTQAIEITGSMVIKAMAVAQGKLPSKTVEYIYTRAGQVAAPSASPASGEVELGTKVTLKSETEGALIYYSTNGTEPTEENLQMLTLYSAPISLHRPVSIKMLAVKKGLHTSVANSAAYTVSEPVIVEKEVETSQKFVTSTDRLTSRRSFGTQSEGPSNTDFILQDNQFGMVVSAPKDIIPNAAVLSVKSLSASDEDKRAVDQALKYRITELYDVNLQVDENAVQPQGEIEIGIPIPMGYQNAIVVVCRINDDGTVDAFPTRRSGGIAYIVTNHLSKYAITVPAAQIQGVTMLEGFPVIVGAALAVSLLAMILTAVAFARKKARMNPSMQTKLMEEGHSEMQQALDEKLK